MYFLLIAWNLTGEAKPVPVVCVEDSKGNEDNRVFWEPLTKKETPFLHLYPGIIIFALLLN